MSGRGSSILEKGKKSYQIRYRAGPWRERKQNQQSTSDNPTTKSSYKNDGCFFGIIYINIRRVKTTRNNENMEWEGVGM